MFHCLDSLPNTRVLDFSNLKAFANDKINVTQNLKVVFGRVENNLGKGDDAGKQCFHFFFSFSGSSKV